jgi:hypothetical protein
MGRFSGLGSIRANQGGIFFKQGNYVVEIKKVENRTTRKGDTFIIETEILESDNPERPAGCKPSQVIVFKPDIIETQMGDVKQFIGAVLGIEDADSYVPEDGQDLDSFWEEALEGAIGDDQPCAGVKLRLNCTNRATKAGGNFTKHVWSPLKEE